MLLILIGSVDGFLIHPGLIFKQPVGFIIAAAERLEMSSGALAEAVTSYNSHDATLASRS